MKTLLIRLDRLGDLLVTLPVDQMDLFKSDQVTWVVPKGLGRLVARAEPSRRYREFNRKISELWDFVKFLKAEEFDRAVVFQAPWWVSLALMITRVPIRVGVLSQWHSFLFFNRGVRQKRSRAEFHEQEYGMKLVAEALGSAEPEHLIPAKLTPPDSGGLLQRFGLIKSHYIVVHPGMGGSARNWSIEHYTRFIKEHAEKELVVVTGTMVDREWIQPIKANLSGQEGVLFLDEALNSDELLEILAGARAVLVPSTGTAHVAAALKVRVVGIYSPVRVQRAIRWGPIGDNVKIVEPKIADCPGAMNCLMQSCPRFDCMESITVEEVERVICENS